MAQLEVMAEITPAGSSADQSRPISRKNTFKAHRARDTPNRNAANKATYTSPMR